MPPLELLFGFSLSALLLSLSPGPSNLYIMACTMETGRASGVAAAGAMALGSLIYTILVALGLASVIAVSPVLFIAIKLFGAGYLLYLGLSAFRQASVSASNEATKTTGNVFWQSLVVELTNPKTALFFVAFLPQFTSAQAGDLVWQLMALGGIYAVIAFCSDLGVVFLSSQLATSVRKKANDQQRWMGYQKQLAALILFGLGLYILVTEALALMM
ncbi:LysE family translocator [Alteromonas halophila]|uniref:Amino acid transporter n=1 Tax=Alteromonas halophila TaxID=516698 RepID=A0A918JQ94_9ALTE|nr:LysE family translocator [Alteromonas halophila]GGW92224.1 amino acid transporter [Alteromonas halophila]